MAGPLTQEEFLTVGGERLTGDWELEKLLPALMINLTMTLGSLPIRRADAQWGDEPIKRSAAVPAAPGGRDACPTLRFLKRFLQTGWLFVLVGWGVALPPAVRAAAPKTKGAQTTAAPTTAKPARKTGVARDPYVGAIVVDAANGKVLFEDQADAKGYPASVLKLMDLLIILERIEQHQLSLQDTVPVSAKAAKTGGSQVWLAEKESFTLDEMLYALMVQSANDAAVALAEKVAGTTDGFVDLMNQRARQLGLTNTIFHSVHGLPPGAGQEHDVTTARDFSRLCLELLKHPETLRYTSTRERPFRPNVAGRTVVMRTHNHLLGQLEGCDGLKTGYITAAGYSIAVTAARNGRRVIAVVLGSADRLGRDAKAAELVAKGFAALPPAPMPAPARTPAPVRSK
jgi:serine-type D-Ala-D-Ala carboxypeptidase (penicillin-binding protein 5/6)